MTTITYSEPGRLIIGVDTHLDNHVASAINSLGVHLGDCAIKRKRVNACRAEAA